MTSDFDLIDFLSADHENLKLYGGTEKFEEEVVKHLTVERALLFPIVESALADGRDQVEKLEAIDDQLMKSSTDEDAAHALVAHIDCQLELFRRLRSEMPAASLVELGAQVPLVVSEAPSHYHLHAPRRGPFRELVSEIDTVEDEIRDRL